VTRNGSGTPPSVASRAQCGRCGRQQSGPLEKGLARIQSSARCNTSSYSHRSFLVPAEPLLRLLQAHRELWINQVLGGIGFAAGNHPDQVWRLFSRCVPPFHCEVTTTSNMGVVSVCSSNIMGSISRMG